MYAGENAGPLWSLSADGKTGWLMFVHAKTSYDIYRVDLESREVEIFLQTPFAEVGPAISPDGRWLLYQSNESGRDEVYVQSLEDDGGKWQISTDGGRCGPVDARRERDRLLSRGRRDAHDRGGHARSDFLRGRSSAAVRSAEPRLGGHEYDVTPDGNRFLVTQPIEQSGAEPLTLVQNWTSGLER